MRIGIVGAGAIGTALGAALADAHEVVFGLRGTGRVSPVVGVPVVSIEEALDADAVVLALPWTAVADLCAEHPEGLAGRVVVDATLGLGGPCLDQFDPLHRVGARYVRAFSTQGPEVLTEPIVNGVPVDQYYTSDDPAPDAVARAVIGGVGMRPVRVGDHTCRDAVNACTKLWFALCVKGPHGVHSGFRFLQDTPA